MPALEPGWRSGAPERRGGRSGAFAFSADRRRLRVGLVNLMPDAALLAAERQFTNLLQAATPERRVELVPFHLPGLARQGDARRRVEAAYRPAREVAGAQLDALVVTGSEPRAARLEEEAYWPALAELVDQAGEGGPPSLWSCLAAHAAVLRRSGLVRRPLPAKCSGLFACRAAGDHPLLAGHPGRAATPHSRGSGLDEAGLRAAGYAVLTSSPEAGVDSFASADGRMLFLQGHPEYEPLSLPLEFRRDLQRYLRGERERPPLLPTGVFGAASSGRLQALLAEAGRERRPELMARWPAELATAVNTWRAPAAALVRNWLELGGGAAAAAPSLVVPSLIASSHAVPSLAAA